MPLCCGVVTYSDKLHYPDPFPVRQIWTSSRVLRAHIYDADIPDGRMGSEFPSLQRSLYVNRNADRISKPEYSFIQ